MSFLVCTRHTAMETETKVAKTEYDPAVNPRFQLPLTDPKLLADLLGTRYVGAFLLKDDANPSPATLLKGKELLNRLHEIGSLAHISSIQGHQAICMDGVTRIRITEMVSEDPLTVKFDYLKNKPYDKDDYIIKETFLQVSSTLRDVLKTNSEWRNHVQHQAQEVLQELDVHKRLQLTLQLAREEMEIIKIEGLGMERRTESEVDDREPVLYEHTPVGVAMALSLLSAPYMETSFIEEGEAIGCLNVLEQGAEETKESANIAYFLARQILLQKQPDNTFFANSILRLDFPSGYGTSAGCTMTTSLLSLARKKPVRNNLAMTGTVTPSGKILGIGSVKEKTIGAKRSQVKTIIFPEANRDDFDELEDNLKEGLDVHFVDDYEQIFELAFGHDEEDETVGTDLAIYGGIPAALYEQTHVGVAMCLAMTFMSGLALYVKTTLDDEHEGQGCLRIMGPLGEGMREIVRIAYNLAIQIILEKKPDKTFFADSVLSIHMPACSTNNGTYAGCTIVTALLSLAMNKPVRKDLAMTGRVTPNGKILGIGSVKEKTIGARRSQVKTIIFPEANRKEFDELPENVKEGLDVHFVDEYDQIFELAFGYDH